MADAPLTLGTAGHIDHGKTALVAALTGVETDRLPEERARGISIELGYAELGLPSGRRMSVVDVPGHERFVRTMVAGATGVDLFLLVVAADDGVMPQTREHAAVLAGLGVAAGVVAITKSDLVDPARAAAEAAELVPDARAVAVSARTGTGIDDLLVALDEVAGALPGRVSADGPTRLHVDRAFTIHGAGTVVTGTLWSGTVARGDNVTIQPRGGRARVRGVQVHDAAVERAAAGQRVAVNLVGVGLDEVARGDVLVSPDATVTPTHIVDVALDAGATRLVTGARVQVHHGTRETAARATGLGGRFWQLRLQRPLVAVAGDRLVVRQIAPPDTLGGGVVLDPHARKHGPSRDVLARLGALERGERPESQAPAARTARSSLPVEELSPAARRLEERLRESGWEPPLDSALTESRAELAALRRAGRAVHVGRVMHFHPDVLADVQRRVVAAIEARGSLTLGELRDELGTSRKFAQALLEHLDARQVTRREGERRVLRGSR